MSKIKVNELEPYSGSYFYVTGTVSSSAGFTAPNGTFSGSTGIYTVLTASQAFIDVLDVNQINSVTTTETSLEVIDKLIIAASGSVDTTLSGSGLQIGGYDTTTNPLASMIYANHSLSLSVTGSETAVMYLSGSGVVGVGTTTPSSSAGISKFIKIEDPSSAGIVLNDTGGREWNIYSVDGKLLHWNSSDGHVLTLWGRDVGIGTSTPATRFDIVDTRTNQFRLSYDTSNYTSFGVSSGGDFTITPSGGDVTISAALTGSNGMVVTGSAKFKDEVEIAGNLTVFGNTTTVTMVTVTGSNGMVLTGSAKFADEAEFASKVTVAGQLTGSNGAYISGDTYITGSFNLSGSATLGQDSDDIIFVVGQLTGSNSIEVDSMILASELTASAANITGDFSVDGVTTVGDLTGSNGAYFAGNVGIGTASPGAKLEIYDEHPKLLLRSNSANGDGQIIFKSLDGTQLFNFRCDTTSNALSHFGMSTGTNENHLVVDGNGNIGIGTTSPGSKLEVSGSVLATTSIKTPLIEYTDGDDAITIADGGSVTFAAAITGSAGMAITGSAKFNDEVEFAGKVGFGTNTPSGKLEVVSGNDGDGTIAVRSGDASQYSKISMGTNANKATIGVPGGSDTFFTDTAAGDLVLRVDDNNGKIHIGAGTSGAAALIVTEHAGTDPRVGIGTASPIATLDVAGHIYPHTDNTYDLGSSSYRWRNIYTGDLHLRNERGDWTIVEEEDFLCVVNNKTGKKYEMMLKPIED